MIEVQEDLVQQIKNKHMKINLEKLANLEAKYSQNAISLSAVQNMVDVVLNPPTDTFGAVQRSLYNTAVETLQGLGVLDDSTVTQQLNS